jgi:uncharacterized OB-fold protein
VKWRCEWCGREYDADDPPCETCGHETFEQATGPDSAFDSGSLVWVCTNCGREHVKHSPPCSRCGNHSLEKRTTDDTDRIDDISSPSYLAVGKPYLVGVAVVIGLVALVVTGVVPFPGFGGPPTPPDAPGDPDRSAGLDLRSVETALHERFETERQTTEAAERAFGGSGTDAYVAYLTRHRVAQQYDSTYDGSVPDSEAFDLRCGSRPTLGVVTVTVDIETFDDEPALADALAEELLADGGFREAVLSERENEAITVHVAPDGTVFVGYIAC